MRFPRGYVRPTQALACAAALFAGTALVTAATKGRMGYSDDTHASLSSGATTQVLRGQLGMQRVDFGSPRSASTGSALDARAAVFTVANSRNPNPRPGADCNSGLLPTNPYPLRIISQDRAILVGGLFVSRVPWSAEWRASYCNSAVMFFRDSPNGIVDGVRITGAWDAIRASRGAPNLTVTNSWISNVRDDALENDHLQPATISDTLIDGAFQGISVKPSDDSPVGDASNVLVTLSGVLIRLPALPYKDRNPFGALAKSDARSPRLLVRNSVVAVDSAGSDTFTRYWQTGWSKLVDPSNNLFLWLSDTPVPADLPLPAAGFRVLKGPAAREAWKRAKRNWIDCHPKLARAAGDPPSDPKSCVAGTWGGFTN